MLPNVIYYAPYEWLVGYVFAHMDAVENIPARQSILELILLGRLPGTNIYLSFDFLMSLSILITWFVGMYVVYKLLSTPQKVPVLAED